MRCTPRSADARQLCILGHATSICCFSVFVFIPQDLPRVFSNIVLTIAGKKNTIHSVTAMLATSENVLFPGHNHQYWWHNTLIIARVPAFVVTWWIVGFFLSNAPLQPHHMTDALTDHLMLYHKSLHTCHTKLISWFSGQVKSVSLSFMLL